MTAKQSCFVEDGVGSGQEGKKSDPVIWVSECGGRDLTQNRRNIFLGVPTREKHGKILRMCRQALNDTSFIFSP